ncbi:type 1 glutamine amidotransferase [Cohnella abietis]|uniref:Amidotransferase n=1 Tax=Cohnella abietis TaxID=2507935 RepID=A0A3T1D7M7_9BACL|nr:type 1 glutamine amidotransferase [Cohnella abietis]BBI34081.1 amidotransferase [Cohnella abietis]
MRIQFAQHVPFENPGAIANWAVKQGHTCSVTHLFAGEELPAMDTWDWLVILGGPMSVHDEAKHSWLVGEKSYIAEAIRSNKIVIGICLGAQLIAEALGAKVYPNDQKEIGWYTVKWTSSSLRKTLLRHFPEETLVFHWHGETYDLPEGAELLASSSACKNQAFVYGNTVFGFQFHLEMLQGNIQLLIENCGDEIKAAPYIQSSEEILNMASNADHSVALLDELLDQIELFGR